MIALLLAAALLNVFPTCPETHLGYRSEVDMVSLGDGTEAVTSSPQLANLVNDLVGELGVSVATALHQFRVPSDGVAVSTVVDESEADGVVHVLKVGRVFEVGEPVVERASVFVIDGSHVWSKEGEKNEPVDKRSLAPGEISKTHARILPARILLNHRPENSPNTSTGTGSLSTDASKIGDAVDPLPGWDRKPALGSEFGRGKLRISHDLTSSVSAVRSLGAAQTVPGSVDSSRISGPPAPDPMAALEARMAEVRRVADGTMTDAALLAVGSAVDIWGTEQCVNNGTCYEANPAGQTSGTARVALKAGLYPVKVGGCYVLRRRGHHKAARILAIVVTAVDVGLGVHAYRLSRKK